MDAIERLTALFEKFPGIGPRQAGRFVQYLLKTSPAVRREIAESLQALSKGVHQCPECMRFHGDTNKICSICSNTRRDSEMLAVVASDSDLAALEKSSTYKGRYFVLGGTLSLGAEKTSGLRIKQFLDSLLARTKKGLQEVILAFPANPEGDATASYLREELMAASQGRSLTLRVTTLGRGLSTGSELEYADPDTLKSAFESRR
jgi:recombination protein RecR